MKDMDIFNGTCDQGQTEFDLIEEFIEKENEQRSAAPLPGPPPIPPELLYESCGGRRGGSSPPSRPVLLSRGTACQPPCSFPKLLPHSPSSAPMAHPARGSASSRPCLRGSKSPCGAPPQGCGSDTEMLERILQKPLLVVVEEPKQRGMRFRYECEGRSAGSILGASSTETNKTQPAVEIQGPIDHLKKVTVTVSLVTKDPPHRPHPHCLVGKDCPELSGICQVTINPHSNRRHSFANLGIQCVRRKELDISLQKRRSQNIDPFKTGDSKGIEDMDMNAVRLCFQCELEWDDGRKDCLSPVVSSPIYDKKATTTSQLKITCLNQNRGSCAGKTEVYMLCDKVQKDDIEIIFRRGSWKANGEFSQTDVHRQIAIVFKTPPYQDQDIGEEVEVSISLRRISDQMESEPIGFTYLPHNPDPYEVKRKRKIKSDVGFREKPCVTVDSAPPVEQPFHFPDDRLCPPQPAASALAEVQYDELMDLNSGADEAAVFNQILEISGVLEMISEQNVTPVPLGFEQGPDANASFFNMDLNQNFGAYTQDFSQYNDLQFNMLFESHAPQLEAPDGLSGGAVQVKTEEEP